MCKLAKLRHRIISACVSFLMAFVFALSVFTGTNPIWGYSGVDSACFILMGRGMINGFVPYRDLVDNKGLVLYLINAIGQLLFQDTNIQIFGIWIIELLFLFFSLLLIDGFTEIFGCKKILSIILQILYLMAIFPLIEIGNMGEEYTCFFTLLAFRLCARYLLEGKTDHFWCYGMSMGVLFSLCFFVRPNNALPIAGMVLALAIYFMIRREWGRLFTSAGTFSVGTFIVVIPIVVYLVVNQALYDCVSQTFLANMNYFGDSGNSFVSLLSTAYGHKAIIYFLICFFGVYLFFNKCRKYDSFCAFALGILTGACLSFFSAFISGFAYLHYLLVSIPSFLISLLLAIGVMRRADFEEKCNKKTEDVHGKFLWEMIYLLPVFLSLMLLAWESPHSFMGNLKSCVSTASSFLREGNYRTNQMLDIAERIPDREKNEVYILEEGESKSTDLYVQARLFPYKRIFICGDRFARLVPDLNGEYSSYFTTDKPEWLILSIPLSSFQMQDQKCMIEDDYMQVYINDYDVGLYHLK